MKSIIITNVVFEKVGTNGAASSKFPPNCNFLWMHCYLVIDVVSYMAVMFVNIAIHPKMHLVAKDHFSAEIGAPAANVPKPRQGSVGSCTGADPSSDAIFTKLKSLKARYLVHSEELTASCSSAHFHMQHQCSKPIWRSFDVRMMADCLPYQSS
ncbi:hypothetical protein Trydic_g7061 [Trypoxylus dichotomus]